MRLTSTLLLCSALLGITTTAFADIYESKARIVFEQYVNKEKAFDPSAADLYCDEALIRNTRTYPTGQKKVLEIPAPKYKDLIRQIMPLAKLKGDYGTYSNVTYKKIKDGVMIDASRHSELKNYDSPITIKVGNCKSGNVGILQEISQSQPF